MTNNPIPFLGTHPFGVPPIDLKTGHWTPAWERWIEQVERVITGSWTPIPYDAANFLAFTGTVWTVAEADVRMLRLYQLGPIAIVDFDFAVTSVDVDTPLLGFLVSTVLVDVDDPVTLGTMVGMQTGGATPLPIWIYATPAAGSTLSGIPADYQGAVVNIENSDASDFLNSTTYSLAGKALFKCKNVTVTT